MRALFAALRGLWELFVEDASLTVGIVACLAIAFFVFPHAGLRPRWRGPLLAAGLVMVLLENVWRSARRFAQ